MHTYLRCTQSPLHLGLDFQIPNMRKSYKSIKTETKLSFARSSFLGLRNFLSIGFHPSPTTYVGLIRESTLHMWLINLKSAVN